MKDIKSLDDDLFNYAKFFLFPIKPISMLGNFTNAPTRIFSFTVDALLTTTTFIYYSRKMVKISFKNLITKTSFSFFAIGLIQNTAFSTLALLYPEIATYYIITKNVSDLALLISAVAHERIMSSSYKGRDLTEFYPQAIFNT